MNDKVTTVAELRRAVMNAVGSLDGCLEALEAAHESDDGEERFNEGRYGRLSLEEIDRAQAALTRLRMRIALRLDGRDSARAAQLDRILDMVREVDDDDDGEPDDGDWLDTAGFDA